MGIEVRIPKEITEYKEKIIFGLSIRQLISFVVAILTGGGSYIGLSKYLGPDIASYLVIIQVIPIFAVGFIQKNGLTFEKYAALMFRHKFGTNKRVYKTALLIDAMGNEQENEKIPRKRRGENVSAIQKGGKTRKKNREAANLEITEKSRKRKSKEAIRKIKAAQQEYRRKQQAINKTIKKREGAEISATDHQIQENV